MKAALTGDTLETGCSFEAVEAVRVVRAAVSSPLSTSLLQLICSWTGKVVGNDLPKVQGLDIRILQWKIPDISRLSHKKQNDKEEMMSRLTVGKSS